MPDTFATYLHALYLLDFTYIGDETYVSLKWGTKVKLTQPRGGCFTLNVTTFGKRGVF